MENITIRPMTLSDIESCAQTVAWTPLWQRYNVTLESATAHLSAGLRDGAIILVADDGKGIPLGFVWLAERGAFDRSGYIRWIAVTANRRSSGVGRQLLMAAEEHTRQMSSDIFLLCSDFNVGAQRFYERNGYDRVGELPNYVLVGITELIYRKRLR
jgi:ribosomal protein S18 acetylase RimI-like enzyme